VPVATVDILPSGLYCGKVIVDTPTETKALGEATLVAGIVYIKALSDNAGVVYIGDEGVSSETGYPLAANEEVRLIVDSLSNVFVDAAISNDGVKFIAS